MSYVDTYQNEKIKVADMSHQHVSNWIWYSKYVWPVPSTVAYFQGVLDSRFDGELLPYKPHSDYKFEIEKLKDMGMIRPNGDIVEHLENSTYRKIGEVYETEKESN